MRAWRKDRHLKRPLCVRASDGAHAIVKALQLDERISQAAIVEVMLRKEARTRRYKPRARSGGTVAGERDTRKVSGF